jgi:PAS domain S-box-containing protein
LVRGAFDPEEASRTFHLHESPGRSARFSRNELKFFEANMTKLADGIWIIDSEARTLYANSAMADILGTTIASLKRQHSFDYVFPEDVEAAQLLFESKQRGEAAPFHFRLRRADGSSIWVDVQGTPLSNATGEFIGIVGTFSVSEDQSQAIEGSQTRS